MPTQYIVKHNLCIIQQIYQKSLYNNTLFFIFFVYGVSFFCYMCAMSLKTDPT